MGTIEIRRRSERLGNIGQVRAADVRTGAAQALAGIAEETRARGRAAAGVGDAARRALDTLGGIAADWRRTIDRTSADEAVNNLRREWEDFYVGGVDAKTGQRRGGRREDADFDPGAWTSEMRNKYIELKEKNFSGLSKSARRMADRSILGHELAAQDSVMSRSLQVADAKARAGAAENYARSSQEALDVLLYPPEDEDARRERFAVVLGNLDYSLEKSLDANRVVAEARPEARRKAALEIVRTALSRHISTRQDEAADLGPDKAGEPFDELENSLRDGDWRALFPRGAAVLDKDGAPVKGGDPLGAALDGADMDAWREAALKDVKSARSRAVHEADARSRETERKTLEGIELVSREAVADGSLASIEGAIGRMDVEAARHPKGSRPHVAAMEAAKRLDAAADVAARRDDWDAILEHAADGTKWEPPKGSRMAKFHKALKASYDRQAQAYAAEGVLAADAVVQEERKANEAALRASMLEAAAVDPGGFSARLAEAAEKGHVTLDQYRKLRDEFRDIWTKEGMPQKGAALVQILKNEFYAGRDYDLNDRLAVNPKTGRFEYVKNPDTKKPFEGEDVEFETTETVPAESHSGMLWSIAPGTAWLTSKPRSRNVTHTLTSDEQLKMLDWAMELAQHDGEWISTDPQTGAKLDKPRKLDAAAEFQDACSRMRTSKRAEASQNLVMERANAMLSLRAGFAQADDAVTGAAAKREAVELKTREALKSAKRRPFAPKMPGGQRGEGAASEGEED